MLIMSWWGSHIVLLTREIVIVINAPMPNSFAFSSAAAAAILAASRESVERLFVADMLMDCKGVMISMDYWWRVSMYLNICLQLGDTTSKLSDV